MLHRERRRVLTPSSRSRARRWGTTNVRNAWPVRHQIYGYLPSCKSSPTICCYQIILLGNRDTCVVTTCSELHSTVGQLGFEPTTYWSQVQSPTATTPSHTEDSKRSSKEEPLVTGAASQFTSQTPFLSPNQQFQSSETIIRWRILNNNGKHLLTEINPVSPIWLQAVNHSQLLLLGCVYHSLQFPSNRTLQADNKNTHI